MVAMVALPSVIGRDDGIFGDGRRQGSVPLTPVLKVHALEEGAAKPEDQGNCDGGSDNRADENKDPTELNIHHKELQV